MIGDYAGYNSIAAQDGVDHLNGWAAAHARCRLVEAQKVQAKVGPAGLTWLLSVSR